MQTEGVPQPSRELVQYARRQIPPAAPLALRLALEAADRSLAPAAADRLWAWAGLGLTLWKILHDAQSRAGREVVNTIYAIHRRLMLETAEGDLAPKVGEALAPYSGWLEKLAADPACKAALLSWVDVFSERLTLHRYTNAEHRKRHARALLGVPVLLSLGESDESCGTAAPGCDSNPFPLKWELRTETQPGGAVPQEDSKSRPPEAASHINDQKFAGEVLRFWDLIAAERQIELGWNRLLPAEGSTMGGFYALAEQARVPDTAAIRAEARKLEEALGVDDGELGQVGKWMREIEEAMRGYLKDWESGKWRELVELPKPPGGWLRKIGSLFGGGGEPSRST